MLLIVALLLNFSAHATSLEANLSSIVKAQGQALESFSDEKSLSLGGFKLSELVTDLALSKSGVLGLSSLEAETAVEIAWGRVEAQAESAEGPELTRAVPAPGESLVPTSEAIYELVAASRKVKLRDDLLGSIQKSLSQSARLAADIAVTELGGFYVDTLRLELNFSAAGDVLGATGLEPALRLRLDWKLKRRTLAMAKSKAPSAVTKLVVQTLKALTEASARAQRPAGFALAKIGVGLGGSLETGSVGLWSTEAGFMGVVFLKPLSEKMERTVRVPPAYDVAQIVTSVSGIAEKSKAPRRGLTPARLSQGFERALSLGTRLSRPLLAARGARWQLVSFKPSFELEQSDLFGLARASGAALVEVEYERE